MVSLLSCVVATLALGADVEAKGLPFGLPPAPADAAVANVAPPQCLFYLNWSGTRSPRATSASETEKLLAEPEVQEFFCAIGKVIIDLLKKQDEEDRKKSGNSPAGDHKEDEPAPAVSTAPKAPPAITPHSTPALPADTSPRDQVAAAVLKEMPKIDFSYLESVELLNLVLTHPTAVFLGDLKVATPKRAEAKAEKKAASKPQKKAADQPPAEQKPVGTPPEEKSPAADSPDIEVQAGFIVSLGSDTNRWRKLLDKVVQPAGKIGAEVSLERIERDGDTWYRSRPAKPGDKNRVTLGFHGNYFVATVGEGVLEGMLARWKGPAPAWYNRALVQTEVPRRTGIVYLNLKSLREKLLPLSEKQKETAAVLELLGLDNVDSLVSTTGLEDYGMVGRTLLALDGKPRGLLDMVSDRPLKPADLEPIPANALVAFAARADLDRSLKILLAVCEKVAELKDAESAKEFKKNEKEAFEKLKKECGIDLHRLLSSVGDTWCVYNSPTEGEIAFLGWTAVVSVRDRAAMVENWETLCTLTANHAKDKKDKEAKDWTNVSFDGPVEFRKCRYAGHDVYYLAGQVIAPALCISDREMVVTLNMPAMKAYLNRKDHRSLATQPGVALALKDGKGPVTISYCDTPKLFDFVYPLISFYGTAAAGAAQQAKVDLEPTYWPSAPAIRRHLRPEVTTVERTAAGLQITSRYSMPWGGGSGLMWLSTLSALGDGVAKPALPKLPQVQPEAMVDPAAEKGPDLPVHPVHPVHPVPPAPSSSKPASPAGNWKPSTLELAPLRPKPDARNSTSQILFAGPEGLVVQWETNSAGSFDSEQLVAPARYNFRQGASHRLKLSGIPVRPGVEFYPTIEISKSVPRSEAFLLHHAVPVEFTDDDFNQVLNGESVTKVIYLPNPEFQEEVLAGVGTIVSTRLDPKADPAAEAARRGAIIAIVRLGYQEARTMLPSRGPGEK